MKRTTQLLAVAGFASALLLSAGNLIAQDAPPPGGGQGGGRGGRGGGGNFDPAQFQQRMMERVKEQLEVTDETEWKALEPMVQKVMDARREVMMGGMGGMRGMGRGPRGGDAAGGAGGDQQNRRPSMFGEPSAEAQALEKAITSKASKDELKAAMAKFRAAKKEKEVKLKEAQENLRKVLTLRQEAIAVNGGYLD